MNFKLSIAKYLNWRNFRFLSLIIVGLFLVGEVGFTHGEDTAKTSETEGNVRFLADIFVKLPSIILGFLTYFVSLFLNPGWVNGEIFNIGGALKDLWIMVSNVVYLVFAFILIVIAFMNIVGKGEGTWELKQALPKFIVGVLIVPLSWFFVQLMISLSSILTVSVLSLPFESFDAHIVDTAITSPSGNEEDKIPTKCDIFLGSVKEDVNEDINENGKDDFFECSISEKKYISEIVAGFGDDSNSIFGLIYIYTYGVMGLDEIPDLDSEDLTTPGGINTITDLISSLGFSIIFIVIYTILMVALFMALLSRGVYLWLYMIFSPLFGLMYFFGSGAPGELGEKFSFKEFIALAMVPVYVAAALSFGLLFLAIASKTIENNTQANEYFVDNGKTLKMGTFELSIEGGRSNGFMGAFSTGKEAAGSLIGELILQMFGLAILWIGVMAALKSSKITGGIIEPIASFGNSVGELIAKSPTYAPLIPTPNGMASSASLAKAGGMVKSHYEQAQTTGASELLKGTQFDTGLTQLNTEATNAATRIRELAQGSSIDKIGTAREISSLIQKGVDSKTMASSSAFHEALKAAGKNLGLTDDQIKDWNLSTQDGIAKAIGDLDEKADGLGEEYSIMKGAKYKGSLGYKEVDAMIKGSSTGSSDDHNDVSGKDFSTLKDTDGDKINKQTRYKDAGSNKHIFYIKDGRGQGYEKFDVTIKTGQNAHAFDNADKAIFEKIYNQLGKDEDKFKEILDKTSFDESVHDHLINDIDPDHDIPTP